MQIFVIDASGERDEIQSALASLASHSGDPNLAGYPFLILANKQDKEGALSPSEVGRLFGWLNVVN